MRITERQIRQIIREELMREQDNGINQTNLDFLTDRVRSKAQELLSDRSQFSVFIPYTTDAELDAKAMLSPPRDGSVTTVWKVDANLQATINRIENEQGMLIVEGSTGRDVSYTTRKLDLRSHADRLLGPPRPGQEAERLAFLNKTLRPELRVESKAMFAIADATRGGTGAAPDGVKSIFIRNVPNP